MDMKHCDLYFCSFLSSTWSTIHCYTMKPNQSWHCQVTLHFYWCLTGELKLHNKICSSRGHLDLYPPKQYECYTKRLLISGLTQVNINTWSGYVICIMTSDPWVFAFTAGIKMPSQYLDCAHRSLDMQISYAELADLSLDMARPRSREAMSLTHVIHF